MSGPGLFISDFPDFSDFRPSGYLAAQAVPFQVKVKVVGTSPPLI
jgi:hypothetical protein